MFNSLPSTHGPATAVASPSSMSMSSQIQNQGVSALFQPLQREGTGRAVATDPENELMNVEEERVHQWASSPIRRSERTTHLPTPQSPNSIGTYVDASSFDTPTRTISRNARMSMSIARTEMAETASTEALTSLITPESSPLFIRRPKSSLTSSSSSLPSTPTRKTQTLSVTESYSALAGPSRPSTPSTPLSANMSIPSVLSSPFVDRVEKLSSNKLSSLRSPGSDVRSSSSPQAPLPSTPPPNLQAPVPQRAAGGEITRLRLQQAAEQAALLQETESRRPEYLKRLKRPSPEVEEDVIVADQENTAPGLGLGVVDSPVKGRRIALFQETSEESFEQSLLAGGYPSYGLTPAYGEPSTPQHTSKSTLSQRAFDWLQQSTPGQPSHHPSTPGMNMKEDPEVVETEQESRKRRRLNAFRDHNAPPSDVRPKLYVVEVEGHGRVLIDHAPENLPLQHTTETPTKKRGNGRRKRGGGVQDSVGHLSPSRKRPNLSLLDSYNDTVLAGRPNWLDQAFPWSMRLHEREELAHREEELKLKWVERYLERDSDEGEDNEDQSLGLPAEDFVEPPPRGGRGKMVPLPAYPANSNVNSRQSPSRRNDKMYYPSDPADARAALLSKRSVRALAYRRMREEEAVCVCRGKDDGRELVQCDDCKEWFHLECIGVTDISDLGREEDPWYCRRCLGIPPARSSSPIFAPTDDRPATRLVRDPLFYQGNPQESPSTLPWHVPRIPKTPSRTLDVPQLSSRGSWDDSSSPVGPQTPSMSHRNVRSYTYETPKAADDFFDPLATPSRGMHFSGPFTTPRPSAFWATRASALQTPSRPTKRPPAPWAFDAPRGEDPFDSSPSRPTYAYDDSPVRRSQPRPEKHVRVPESPSPSPLLGLGKRIAAVDRTHSQNALG